MTNPELQAAARESPIETFAREVMGTRLHPAQVEVLRAFADNKTIFLPRASGRTFAYEVMRRYIEQALQPKEQPDAK